jgi:type II secretory pathway predicted ATPase ExeA/cell division septation protein DedD
MNFRAFNPGANRRSDSAKGSETYTYEAHYGLAEKPFSLFADPRFLYRSRIHGPAFDDLLAAIQRREGLIVVTGDIGVGKTTLCRSAIEHLDRKTFSAFVPDPFMAREDLLKTLLIDFGVVSADEVGSGRLRAASRLELSYVLRDFLDSLVSLDAVAVVVIDEAQNLSLPMLEEVRILSEPLGRQKRLQVVLVGQLELETQLKLPQMRQLDQRVAMRCRLESLSQTEAARYIEHRLGIAGAASTRASFTPGALLAIHEVTHGVPRVINLLCDRALHESWLERANQADVPHVLKAAQWLGLTSHGEQPVAVAKADATPPGLTSFKVAPADMDPIEPAGWSSPDFLPEEQLAASQARSRRRNHAGVTAAVLAAAVVTLGTSAVLWQRPVEPALAHDLQIPKLPAAPPHPFFSRDANALQPPGRYIAVLPITEVEKDLGTGNGSVTFAIQIASFTSAAKGAELVAQLHANGIRARVVERDLGDRGRWHQVLADGYVSLTAAEADLSRIKQMPGYADARLIRDIASN